MSKQDEIRAAAARKKRKGRSKLIQSEPIDITPNVNSSGKVNTIVDVTSDSDINDSRNVIRNKDLNVDTYTFVEEDVDSSENRDETTNDSNIIYAAANANSNTDVSVKDDLDDSSNINTNTSINSNKTKHVDVDVHVNENEDVKGRVRTSGNAQLNRDSNEKVIDEVAVTRDVTINSYVDDNVQVDKNINTNNNVAVMKNVDVQVNRDTVGDIDMDRDINKYRNTNNNVDTARNRDVKINDVTDRETSINNSSHATVGVELLTFLHDEIDVNKLSKEITARKKRVRFEDRHKRRTVWLENQFDKLLELEQKNGGNITRTINEALRIYYNLKAKGLLD